MTHQHIESVLTQQTPVGVQSHLIRWKQGQKKKNQPRQRNHEQGRVRNLKRDKKRVNENDDVYLKHKIKQQQRASVQ